MNKHHCKYTPYLCLFSLLYFNYLYILLFWNFRECNVYCKFVLFISLLFIIYFTCFGNVKMFPMPIEPFNLIERETLRLLRPEWNHPPDRERHSLWSTRQVERERDAPRIHNTVE